MSRTGVVVIGRNEGERLARCFDSLEVAAGAIVYVDSGSTDGSVEMARTRAVQVVALDLSVPFTAARARNAGVQRLLQLVPEVDRVQFVDGDCEMIDGWFDAANRCLDENAQIACVCGRLRERFPERSIYNRLCDFEWERPPGDTDACGGIAMMRVSVLNEVDGFREDMVAGEEPELCQRIRQQGWKVHRLPVAMAWHDAAMLRFGQWWKRSKRAGFSYAQRISLLGSTTERGLARQALRTWLWAALVPVIIFLCVALAGPVALILTLVYPIQILRIALGMEQTLRIRLERAFFIMLGKFPELLGQLQFWLGHRRRRGITGFDYKS